MERVLLSNLLTFILPYFVLWINNRLLIFLQMLYLYFFNVAVCVCVCVFMCKHEEYFGKVCWDKDI